MTTRLTTIVKDAEPETINLLKTILSAGSEAKGKDIAVLNVNGLFSSADYFVVISGRSDRQVQGISNRILDAALEKGVTPYSSEGMEEGQWVLLDFGDVIVHTFYEPLREHYDIEGLWARAEKFILPEAESSRKLLAA